MTITLNGEETSKYDAPLAVSALLERLGFAGKPVLVELNGTALYPREFDEKQVEDGARVEVIQIAAGG